MTTTDPTSATTCPAGVGQVERPVRPGAEALLPCPCGAICTADEDSLYPINRERTLWNLHCVDPACGWRVVSGSADECIRDWSRRASLDGAVAAMRERCTRKAADIAIACATMYRTEAEAAACRHVAHELGRAPL